MVSYVEVPAHISTYECTRLCYICLCIVIFTIMVSVYTTLYIYTVGGVNINYIADSY